jgi:hypothetical protein
MLMFLSLNGMGWKSPGDDETVATIEGIASGAVPEDEFVEWVRVNVP